MTSKNQGEGDRASARKYAKHTESFAKSGKVEPKAKAAKKAVEGEEGEGLAAAEKAGKAKAKERDPAVARDYRKSR